MLHTPRGFMSRLYNFFDRLRNLFRYLSKSVRREILHRHTEDRTRCMCTPTSFTLHSRAFAHPRQSRSSRRVLGRRRYPQRGSPRLAAIFAALEARAPREHTRPVSVSQNVVLRRLCAAWPTYPR